MDISSQLTLNAFLHDCSPQQRGALSQFLSSAEKKVLENLPRTYKNPLVDTETLGQTLVRIHPSWISPFVRNLSEKEIGFFLSALEPSQAKIVAHDLRYSASIPEISQPAIDFLQETLFGYLTAEIDELSPVACLPESPLNVLLEVKNTTFNLLLEFLGLHDLSLELRQIIDRNILDKIYRALTPSQLDYLKMLQQSPEPIVFPKMRLAEWNGDVEKLKTLLRQRGANRLAKALHGQDSSLVFYLLHKLDIGNALVTQKLISPLENPRTVQLLIHQILEFFSFIQGSAP